MNLAVGTGDVSVYMPAGGLSGQPFPSLFGLPVIVIEQAASVGTLGDVILADFANGYVLAEKGGIAADMSIHVRFEYDKSCFRFVMRVDGQPVLANAITPFKGTASTQSHFVAIATR
jgi:HK97 family phage major capsid protein